LAYDASQEAAFDAPWQPNDLSCRDGAMGGMGASPDAATVFPDAATSSGADAASSARHELTVVARDARSQQELCGAKVLLRRGRDQVELTRTASSPPCPYVTDGLSAGDYLLYAEQ